MTQMGQYGKYNFIETHCSFVQWSDINNCSQIVIIYLKLCSRTSLQMCRLNVHKMSELVIETKLILAVFMFDFLADAYQTENQF